MMKPTIAGSYQSGLTKINRGETIMASCLCVACSTTPFLISITVSAEVDSASPGTDEALSNK
jgi:hypothetical protein